MNRAQLTRQVKRLVELRAIYELAAATKGPERLTYRRYVHELGMMVFSLPLETELPEGVAARLERIAGLFFGDWLKRSRTSEIRRAKRSATDRASRVAVEAMRQAVGRMPGRGAG